MRRASAATRLTTDEATRSAQRARIGLIALAVTGLVQAGDALAGNTLRGGGVPSASALPSASAAAAAAAQVNDPALTRAFDAIRAAQAAQDAARAQASGNSQVRNGLGPGGLEISTDDPIVGASTPEQTTATEVTIKQSAPRAILTWKRFDVGSATEVHFDQTAGNADAPSWVALNRVTDPNAAPSRILGSIRAEGQVYLINRSGILFGAGSSVNVATLLVSGLDIAGPTVAARNDLFLNGALTSLSFAGPGGGVALDPGAHIEVAPFGRAVLFGGAVSSRGSIEAPDGQVLMAAGESIALQGPASDLSAIRGLGSPLVTGAGVVENGGMVSTPRGNITLVAPEVWQNGLLTATTGAEQAGSITVGGDGSATTLGAGSVTQVLPDVGGKKVVGDGVYSPSRVVIGGERITMLAGSTIYVPAGDVSLSAQMTVDPTGSNVDVSRVYVSGGARIDVSGLKDVEIPMSRNTIMAELRANELRDNPVVRNNPAIRGRTVTFDARLGAKGGFADLSGYYDLVERDVTEVMTNGGNVTLAAAEIITRAGSTIDLSGGSLRFLAGTVTSTILIDPEGHAVRIEDAVAGVPYVGILGDAVVTHGRWGVTETYATPLGRSRPHWEPGYDQGGSAGALHLSTNDALWFRPDPEQRPPPSPSATGRIRVLDGEIRAATVVGPKQREQFTGSTDPTQSWRQRPRLAVLDLQRAGDVEIADTGAQLPADFRPDSAASADLRYRQVLPARLFDGKTFGQLAVTAGFDSDEAPQASVAFPPERNRAPGGHLTIGPGVVVDLGDYGSLTFVGKGATVDGTISAPGGSVSLDATQTVDATPTGGGAAGEAMIRVGGAIDVAGRLTNDRFWGAGAPMRALNGGTIAMSAGTIELASGSLLDVSGGERIDVNGKATAGNGGSIALDVSKYLAPGLPGRLPPDGKLVLDGWLRGYAAGTGGALAISTVDALLVGASPPPLGSAHVEQLDPSFFRSGGFASFRLLAERGITIEAGTEVVPRTEQLALATPAANLPTGALLADVATRMILPDGLHAPMTLSLSTVPSAKPQDTSTPGIAGDLRVEEGAALRLPPGSRVSLAAIGTLRVDGTVEAPGGSITLTGDDKGLVNLLGPARIELGANARILAPGVETESLVSGSYRRSMLAGGTVTLSTPWDFEIDPQARIDVSGRSGTVDLLSGGDAGTPNTWAAVPVAGSAGSITIAGATGLVVGDLRLAAGGAAGLSGSLTVKGGGPLGVRQSVAGAAVAPLTVVADAVNASGAGDVTLQVMNPTDSSYTNAKAIVFQGDVDLRSDRSLTLVTPILGTVSGAPGHVTLSSRYVQLHGAVTSLANTADAADLGSALEVRAGLIDVSGQLLLGCAAGSGACPYGGFGTARLASQGDLRLSDHDAAGRAAASPRLVSTGAIELAASQVYVEPREQSSAAGTLERDEADPGFLVQSAQRITVSRSPDAYRNPVPLSFGERLTLRAPEIDQGGVLRAPLGQIRLEATGPNGTVTLRPGSVTSSSLEGALVPFGSVLTGGVFFGYDQPGQAPSKSVRLTGATVSIASGAVVDVTGGGDLFGFQFVPGNGGSRDILSTPNAFAVLPSLGAGPAPIAGVDVLRDTSLRVGDAVWLQGVPGLSAGFYTPLPAHYALLPGAFLVVPQGGSYATAPATQIQADGSVSAAGYRTLSGTPGFTRYVVMSQPVFESYSQLALYSFTERSSALAAQAGVSVRTPADGGAVVLSAGAVALDGTGRFAGGPGGQGGSLDLAAPRIAVVSDGAVAPDASYLSLDAGALTAFGAASVFLGGTRTTSSGTQGSTTSLYVTTTDLYVATSAATPLTGQELLLAATGSITVKDGSVLRAEGPGLGAAAPLVVNGDGALLRLSTGGRAELNRTGIAGATGSLAVGAATLSGASLTLDGTRQVTLAPAAALVSTQLELASARINLGDAPAGTPGATLGSATLAQLGSGSDLLFRGYGSIELYGDLALGTRDASGSRTLRALTLDSGLIQGHAGPNGATITADTLTLRNSGGGSTGAARSGTLTLDVDALNLGPGEVRLAGYDFVQGIALVVTANQTGGITLGGSLALATDQVRATSGASYSIEAATDLSLFRASNATPSAPSSLGGAISLVGGEVLIDTGIVLPAGSFSATARSGSLVLGDSAGIDVRGVEVALGDQPRFAPGGTIQLTALGDLAVASQARLDVSGAAAGGSAGSIGIAAGLDASVLGALAGTPGTGGRAGSFTLDAGTYGTGDVSGLNAALNAGGFTEGRSLRLRQQDLSIGASDRIVAHDVTLRSDAGAVRVAGEVASAGSAGGRIAIQGGAGITVDATAHLDVRASDPTAASGSIELAADGGRVDVVPGSILDLDGGRSGGGALTLRAPREGTDVAVDRIGGDVRGAREVVVQGVQGYATATVDAAIASLMISDAKTWLAAAGPAVAARLQGTNPGLPPILVAPAMLVTSSRDLTVTTDLDLSSIGDAAGTPGDLALVAAQDLRVGARQADGTYRGSISDGFAGPARDAALSSGRSFSLRLEAGNDVVLEPGTIVRTGTGDLALVAGRDVSLVAPVQPTDTPAVVYTAGRRADTPGYQGPPGAILGEFPLDGGDLLVSAGRDVLAPIPTQSSSAWLFRDGATSWGALSASGGDQPSSTVATQGSWSVVFANFEQGVGALGGGDVTVRAGRDVVQLGVAIPTTGYVTTPVDQVPAARDLVVRGGGDLTLIAGRDLVGGQILMGRGDATVTAGGSLRATDQTFGMRTSPDAQALGPPRGMGLLLGLMDATAELTAARDLYVEGVFDPMTQGQIAANLANGVGSAHWSYTDRTALTATSLAGAVTYESNPWASVDVTAAGKPEYRVLMGTGSGGSGGGALNTRFGLAPSTLRLVSLGDDVVVTDPFGHTSMLTLAAASRGQLELLAMSNVRLALGTIQMDDTAPGFRHDALFPFETDPGGSVLGQNKTVVLSPLHLGDPDPVTIRAAEGSVCAQRSGACSVDTRSLPTTISMIKPVDVVAGTDVLSGNWVWTNNEPSDLGRLDAGRDVYAVTVRASGEGTVRLDAGRNVVLNQDSGLLSKGGQIIGTAAGATTSQPVGPQFFILAGTNGGLDYDGFASVYLDPANASQVPRTYVPELRTYMEALGYSGSDAQLYAAFQALPLPRRQVLVDRVYLEELKQTGIDYNDASSPRYHQYDRGYEAIARLFPGKAGGGAATDAGDVILNAKPVETQAQGDINILAPYGRIAVGAEVVPANVDPAAGGVVTRRGGSVRMMADENIDLYTSRVFTLQGGDILMWTSNGSITAGAGSKTSVFQKPLAYTMSPEGVIAIDAFGLQTGAGIGVLDALLGTGERPRSRLDLIAPRGEVNAGDAGIRVVGDLNIAAQVIVGVENIQVSGGQSSGVPKVEMPSLAVLTAASTATQGATRDVGSTPGAGAATTPPPDLPSIITVEVVGYETEPGDGRDEKKDRKRQ
jgi:filamentous hemagglutinin family protein